MRLIPGEWRYFDETLNMPYPWYTRPCLEWLTALPLSKMKIFEYGVGDSTKWFRYFAVTAGVDTNKVWANTYSCLWCTDRKLYTEAIHTYPFMFDIVCIDGDFRDECTEHALERLNHGGFLIIDNYKQKSFEGTWDKTEKLIEGMQKIIFKEASHEDWQTIVVTK